MKTKKSIEIPFGAKDSELKGWEYTIPEGMEAEIKNDKIIVREKESEDERIRKAILELVKQSSHILNPMNQKSMIAWLKKQDEKEYALKSFKDEDMHKFVQYIERQAKAYELNLPNRSYDIYGFAKDILSWLEEQGSQNLANSAKTCKIEPKFKVGDWVINTITSEVEQIIDITDREYICSGILIVSFDNQHLLKRWTINDAKDGDVLAEHETIVLFKKIEGLSIRCYCTYHYLGYNPTFYVDTLQNKNPYCPATKEQCDLLFQKMKEAGYEWNAEKKELKKVEQKPNVCEGCNNVKGCVACVNGSEWAHIEEQNPADKDELFDHRYAQHLVESQRQKSMIQWKGNNLKEAIDFTGKDKNFDKWFNSFEEYEQYVQKHNGIFKLFNADGSHYEIPVGAWIVKTPDGYNVASQAIFKQKTAWSEEDEDMMDDILKAIQHLLKENDSWEFLEDCLDWLRAIKDRVQPKQEWSEEDEHRITDTIYFLETAKKHYASTEELDACIEYLKSIKERYTWKPSDEQMECLLNTEGVLRAESRIAMAQKLSSLYNDLKALCER